ncbi:MAG: fumarylacetoacetate hydrolase family protein, partial [Betaproteobacteria bacterium]
MKRARIAFDGRVHDVVAPVSAGEDVLTLAGGRRVDAAQVVWLPPVEPRTAFALAINYADHAKELSFKKPDAPLVFLKGRNTFVGHRARSRRTADATFMHYECELAVVIGRAAR